MHGKFPDGTSLRYRSSTNNEDLPGFSGAGLYDSKTQDPEETAEDGIDKSIKGVWASLWNFRAFVERDFHRVDHLTTAMGVLVHPNYSDELANGVAVSYDPINAREGVYYVNTQIGEDLVTNPDANSVPEELLLLEEDSYEVLVYSNQAESEQLLMSDAQIEQLRGHLATIHDKFDELYDPDDGERFAMEIEFKITSGDVLAIKQARPWIFRPLNQPPEFPSTETGVRQVAEGTPPGTEIGAPVEATDAEGDVLTYSLSDPDAGFFLIRPATGALLAWADLDYETQATYSVTVEVLDRRDSAGRINASADAMLMVSIMLTNEEELARAHALIGADTCGYSAHGDADRPRRRHYRPILVLGALAERQRLVTDRERRRGALYAGPGRPQPLRAGHSPILRRPRLREAIAAGLEPPDGDEIAQQPAARVRQLEV